MDQRTRYGKTACGNVRRSGAEGNSDSQEELGRDEQFELSLRLEVPQALFQMDLAKLTHHSLGFFGRRAKVSRIDFRNILSDSSLFHFHNERLQFLQSRLAHKARSSSTSMDGIASLDQAFETSSHFYFDSEISSIDSRYSTRFNGDSAFRTVAPRYR